MSLKNHKGTAILSSLLIGLAGLTFYTICQFQATPGFLTTPNSLNMIFVLIFLTMVIALLAIINYMPKNN
ncbi:MAG: hypothetical protein ACTSO9_00465 [Candidatus Helarchaeota archaeon]